MAMPPDLPKSLWKIRDEIVDSAFNDLTTPSDIKLVQEWLVSDGVDNLWTQDVLLGYVINLDSLAQWHFYDKELEYSDELTDKLRIEHARKIISDVVAGDDNTYGVHGAKLEKDDGKLIYSGCIQESQGQNGLAYEWFGVFKNLAQLLDEVRNLGYFFTSEINTITDEEILAVWNKN
jgi:hypothetical protein